MNARNIKLVATDLDGTLLRPDHGVSERTRRAIAQVQGLGIVVVPATGRPPRWVVDPASEAGLAGPAICANGALTYDLSTGRVLDHSPLRPDVSRPIISALRELVPDVSFAFEIELTFAREPDYDPHWLAVADRAIEDDAERLARQPVTKILVRHPTLSAAELQRVAQPIISGRAEATFSSPELLEISAAGVTKASGLAGICLSSRIGPEQVVAFGDMPNDLPLFEWCGWSVAVANALPVVLGAADETTASNADDGVAQVLERMAQQLDAGAA